MGSWRSKVPCQETSRGKKQIPLNIKMKKNRRLSQPRKKESLPPHLRSQRKSKIIMRHRKLKELQNCPVRLRDRQSKKILEKPTEKTRVTRRPSLPVSWRLRRSRPA